MSFAEPRQLLVSRSYYDIIFCLLQEYAQLFQYKGAKADKHIREHDIYSMVFFDLSGFSDSQLDYELISDKASSIGEETRKKWEELLARAQAEIKTHKKWKFV